MANYTPFCFVATSPILGEELRNNDIQSNSFTLQTFPLLGGEYPEGR